MPPEAGLDDDLGTQTIDTGLSSGQSGGHPALLTYYYAHKTWTLSDEGRVLLAQQTGSGKYAQRTYCPS